MAATRERATEGQTMTRRMWALVVLLMLPGLLVAAVGGYYALVDWHQLQEAYGHYRAVVASEAGLRAVFVANAAQETHRVNLFADVVWALQGALLFGVGLVGVCLLGAERRERPTG